MPLLDLLSIKAISDLYGRDGELSRDVGKYLQKFGITLRRIRTIRNIRDVLDFCGRGSLMMMPGSSAEPANSERQLIASAPGSPVAQSRWGMGVFRDHD